MFVATNTITSYIILIYLLCTRFNNLKGAIQFPSLSSLQPHTLSKQHIGSPISTNLNVSGFKTVKLLKIAHKTSACSLIIV